MEGKNGKNSSSKTPNDQQRSLQRAEGSTQQRPPSSGGQRQPPTPPPPSRSQGGGRSLAGRVWGRMPPNMNLHAVPAVGGGSSSGSATAPSIGGFPATDAAASRKRMRDAVFGKGGGDPSSYPLSCPVCGNGFFSDKSLFGHMRTHRDRSWKGALPPPVFSREEFADTGLLNPEGFGEEDKKEEGIEEQEVNQPVQVVREVSPPPGDAVGIQQEARRRVRLRVLDLNRPPPRDDDEDN